MPEDNYCPTHDLYDCWLCPESYRIRAVRSTSADLADALSATNARRTCQHSHGQTR